jgi:ectoine hydroxylase
VNQADPYPSRVGGEARVQRRSDPVVHSSGAERDAGPLSTAELARYEQQGFLCLDHFLDAQQTGHIASEAQRLFRERRNDPDPRVVREPGDDEVRSIFRVHEDVEAVATLVRNPKLLALASQILGGPAYIHQSRINYKPAFRGQPFHWHSDFETWHVEDGMPRMRAFSVSIGLTENRTDNGPLMVIPGSHRHFICCPGRTPEAHYERSLRRQEAGVPPDPLVDTLARDNGIEVATGMPGSLTVFDCNLMHGSNGNITPYPRSNLFLVFNAVENALAPPYSGQAPRPEHVATRQPKPLSSRSQASQLSA